MSSSGNSSLQQRRIDVALSQLVNASLPPLDVVLPEGNNVDNNNNSTSTRERDLEAVITETESKRHDKYLSRVYRVIDLHNSRAVSKNSNESPTLGTGTGSTAENINNTPDLIKRKLLRENTYPDKAVRFSNLYTRLLTQPVLSQKWAILYLLYQLSDSGLDSNGHGHGNGDDGYVGNWGGYDANENVGERSRSPLLDEGDLQNMTFRKRDRSLDHHYRWKGRGRKHNDIVGSYDDDDHDDNEAEEEEEEEEEDDDDGEGPAINSSASQRPGRVSRSDSLRRPDNSNDREEGVGGDRDHSALWPPGRHGWTRDKSFSRSAHSEKQNEQQQASFTDNHYSGRASEPLEYTLLRDLPYNLQGISSTNIKFKSPSTLSLPPNIPVPMISLLHTLAEPCLLYKGLANFVEASNGGLVMQSLRSAIANELRSYLGLVATLEVETRRALVAIGESTEPKAVSKGGVTLRRFVAWTRDATMALRLMSLFVEEAQSKYYSSVLRLLGKGYDGFC